MENLEVELGMIGRQMEAAIITLKEKEGNELEEMQLHAQELKDRFEEIQEEVLKKNGRR